MASNFDFNAPTATPVTGSNVANFGKGKKKVDAYLNLYMKGKNGENKKIGALFMYNSSTNQKAVMAWLNEDPTRIEKLMSKLILTYVVDDPDAESDIDFND